MLIVAVETGHLQQVAAISYRKMRAAGLPKGITSSYRTYAQQDALRRLYLRGKGAYALPAGTSMHERGLAIDLPFLARLWASTKGLAYGWRRTNPREPWHFEYVAKYDKHINSPAKVAAIQRAVHVHADGHWGVSTEAPLNLVRAAAVNKLTPRRYVLATQVAVGARQDGVWGPRSRAALLAAVRAIQAALGVTADGVWGKGTDAAWARLRADNYMAF